MVMLVLGFVYHDRQVPAAYKYPMKDPDPDTIQRIQAIVEEAEPPRYENQGGQKKNKNKRSKGDDDNEAVEDPDEVLEGMEMMCAREAQKEVMAQAGVLML